MGPLKYSPLPFLLEKSYLTEAGQNIQNLFALNIIKVINSSMMNKNSCLQTIQLHFGSFDKCRSWLQYYISSDYEHDSLDIIIGYIIRQESLLAVPMIDFPRCLLILDTDTSYRMKEELIDRVQKNCCIQLEEIKEDSEERIPTCSMNLQLLRGCAAMHYIFHSLIDKNNWIVLDNNGMKGIACKTDTSRDFYSFVCFTNYTTSSEPETIMNINVHTAQIKVLSASSPKISSSVQLMCSGEYYHINTNTDVNNATNTTNANRSTLMHLTPNMMLSRSRGYLTYLPSTNEEASMYWSLRGGMLWHIYDTSSLFECGLLSSDGITESHEKEIRIIPKQLLCTSSSEIEIRSKREDLINQTLDTLLLNIKSLNIFSEVHVVKPSTLTNYNISNEFDSGGVGFSDNISGYQSDDSFDSLDLDNHEPKKKAQSPFKKASEYITIATTTTTTTTTTTSHSQASASSGSRSGRKNNKTI